ncbi:hypothetical protein DPMN_143288 [Dreissena polymorpha]|uniref:Uncharacterized protein n=1 Tax=Dreissena polymorpha TaxID=45954 RepID=A0A9D4GDE1_DREPO|nr:hypothetical protein DPMN_143288 [Dreissena polymorpha]
MIMQLLHHRYQGCRIVCTCCKHKFHEPTGTNLTKFRDDRTINVASRKNAPPPDIIGTNLLTKFHEDRKINVASRVLTRKNAPPPGGHYVFQPTGIILKLFHENRTINVISKVKNAPPLDSHVFQANVSIFKLQRRILGKIRKVLNNQFNIFYCF